MSHFTKVATKINNLTALLKALENLKYTFTHDEQGVEVRGYQGQKMKAEVCINMGTYDIGVVKNEAGSYEFVADWWGIETTVGKYENEVMEEINKQYAYVRVVQACEEQGYQIVPEDVQQLQDGTVKLVASKWG